MISFFFSPEAEGDLRVIGELVAVLDLPTPSTTSGRADYVLYDDRGRPLAVIETKKNAIHPYVAKQQALPYAKALGAPFIFLTNGELTYFWDYRNDDARAIAGFFSRRDLERMVEMRTSRHPLATIEIPEHYVRQGETRTVRPYQIKAMHALDHALELGKRRFLIELPTGTGKTDLVCLYLKRLFQGRMGGTRARAGGPRPARTAGARSDPGSASRLPELLAAAGRRAPGAADHGSPAPDDDSTMPTASAISGPKLTPKPTVSFRRSSSRCSEIPRRTRRDGR